MWLNIVAGWLALNAAVVTIATLSRFFGPKRRSAPVRTRTRVRPAAEAAPPASSPTLRPTGRHPARHARHQPVRDASGDPPSAGSPRSRPDR